VHCRTGGTGRIFHKEEEEGIKAASLSFKGTLFSMFLKRSTMERRSKNMKSESGNYDW
jgi:hypothetical protein